MGDELVECHSGFEYAERPVALHWEGHRLKVIKIEAQWRTENGKHFRVQASDEKTFVLIYDEMYDKWQVFPA